MSGTAPIGENGECDEDIEWQANRCLEIISDAIEQAGMKLEDVIRTRMYITNPADSVAVGRVHGRYFGSIRPASTMVVVAALLDPRWRVEIEAEAFRAEA